MRELLNPSASNRSRYSGVSLIRPLFKCFASLLCGLRVSYMKLFIDERIDLLIAAFSAVSFKSLVATA